VLIGTAHISRESADLVREVIVAEQPDCVCIELDEQRFKALSQEERFESLDLREVIRQRQLTTLMMNLMLASYQRQLGGRLGVMPGTELLEAAKTAQAQGVPIELCDRDVRVTLRRAWRRMSLWKKFTLLSGLLAAVFERQEVSEEDLRELREQDVLSKLMSELGEAFPALKTVLIDERDTYLTEKMRRASGERVVAVVGAGHVPGIRAALESAGGSEPVDLEPLEEVPAARPYLRWLGWGIPALIVGSLVAIGVRQGSAAAGENLLYWVLANGIPSSIGALLALGHPATIIAAFLSAPLTSLTPVIGAGYVTAFVQTYYRPPLVKELQHVGNDIASPIAWWRNRLLRIFLVFLLTTIGSFVGTWVGGVEIISNLF